MKRDKIAIVIQCRDGSTRYKEKSVRPFYKGKSILEIIVDKFKHLPYHTVVTTTPESPKTIEICEKHDIDYMVGPEGEVLSCMCDVVEAYDLGGIFRACADSPFIQLPLMCPLSMWYGYDYVAFKDAMKRHEGFFVEYASAYAIKEANRLNTSPYERRHVTPFIYDHGKDYKVKWLRIPPELEKYKIRLTVDTKEDFELAQEVYAAVGEKHWFYIIDYLYYRPHLIRKMEENIKRNKK